MKLLQDTKMTRQTLIQTLIFFAAFIYAAAYLSSSIKGNSQHSKISGNNRVMAWLCLEFCDETPEMIAADLLEIEQHRSSIAAVSFEKYTLGPNSTLVDNQLTVVSPVINKLGLESWPLLSSYPHPPEFIDWMRQVIVASLITLLAMMIS